MSPEKALIKPFFLQDSCPFIACEWYKAAFFGVFWGFLYDYDVQLPSVYFQPRDVMLRPRY